MSISDLCQIVTATIASISFLADSFLRYRNNKYSIARNVCSWIDDKEPKLYISNHNPSSLYNVFIFMDLNVYEASLKEHLERITKRPQNTFYFETFPANQVIIKTFKPDPSAGGKHDIPFILFTDTNGNHWYRKSNGKLKPLYCSYMDLLVQYGHVLGHVDA